MLSAFGSNSPAQKTVIKVEARKSFSFALWVKDSKGKMLDITGTSIRLVVKKDVKRSDDDSDNLIINHELNLTFPSQGFGKFDLQASDLDLEYKEYPFSIVIHDQGYSSVLVKGVLEVVPNTESDSLGLEYDGAIVDPPIAALQVMLRGRVVVEVKAGNILPPGTTSFTYAEQEKLSLIEDGAQVNVNADWEATDGDSLIMNKPQLGSAAFMDVENLSVPPGGSPGEVLGKRTSADFDVVWMQQSGGGGGSGLDATGVDANKVPTANGVDSWSWQELPPSGVITVNGQGGDVELDMDDIPDSSSRLALTPAERSRIAADPDWADIQNKPAFGTAALEDDGSYIRKASIDLDTDVASGTLAPIHLPKLSTLPGYSAGTSAPTGGEDGDVYFQYS